MAQKRKKKRTVKRKPLWIVILLTVLGVFSQFPQLLQEQQGDAAVDEQTGIVSTQGELPTANGSDITASQKAPAISGNDLVNGYVKADIEIPPYTGEPYTVLNDNIPFFSEEERSCTEAFEYYSELDDLGRCGMTVANICTEIMPEEERGEIGQIKPTGWHTVKYDCIADRYLYNRCHLIGYQLSGENANVCNLITGTRYLNMEGMLPFENRIAQYVENTDSHVLYRVVPYFSGDNLVADGVLMEGWSVEDGGEGVCFCVFAYNVQPGIIIDYTTGDSHEAGEVE